VTTQDS